MELTPQNPRNQIMQNSFMTPLKTRGTDAENSREAKYVEDGSPVLKSGAVKTFEIAVTKPCEK